MRAETTYSLSARGRPAGHRQVRGWTRPTVAKWAIPTVAKLYQTLPVDEIGDAV